MVFTILISIVFIADIIITITVLQNLMKLDKKILEILKNTNFSKKKTFYKILRALEDFKD